MGLTVICDAEFDSLTPTKLWCVVCKELETEKVRVFRYDVDTDFRNFIEYSAGVSCWIGHNFSCFDSRYLTRLVDGFSCLVGSVIDTLILSRLINAARAGGHSLENIGKAYGLVKKKIIVYDDPTLIDEYVERCVSDVEINYQFYKNEIERFVKDPDWQDAIKLEHDLALICQEITDNGFGFNKEAAEVLLDDISSRLNTLTKEIRNSVGPIREISRQVTLRRKKDGSPDKRTLEFLSLSFDNSNFDSGDTVVTYTGRDFNPASPKDRINLLNKSGWKPTEKTKTHQRAEFAYKRRGYDNLPLKDKQRWGKLKETGWKCSEVNLQTLPEDAPTGAKSLAQWLTLEGRRSDLQEWLDHYNPTTESLHSSLIHIGGWTQRCAHRNPNCANIFSLFHGEVKTPVDQIKDQYDGLLRSLWQARKGKCSSRRLWLVGTDAEGIQLRVLAHLMNDKDYIEAVANGVKENGTDVHNVNREALGIQNLIRDDAKTFIYAWLLGAGTGKVASILKCDFIQARRAVSSFVEKYPGLKRLRHETIPLDARRGYFTGLDGRKVICNSEHLMLAGYLQNGEKIIVVRSLILWKQKLQSLGISYKIVNFVHDEYVTECNSYEDALKIKEVQEWSLEQAGKDLNLNIKITGNGIIGKNWLEIH